MRSLPFDTSITAFESEVIGSRDRLAILMRFLVDLGLAFLRNLPATLAVMFCTLFLTSVGLNHFGFLMPENYADQSLDGQRNPPALSCAGLGFVAIGLFDLRDDLVNVANIGVYTRIPDVTCTMVLLTIIAYDLIELAFGFGEGYNWAPDFIIAFVAAWALRVILGWDDYGRFILGLRAVQLHKRYANESFESRGDAWFVS